MKIIEISLFPRREKKIHPPVKKSIQSIRKNFELPEGGKKCAWKQFFRPWKKSKNVKNCSHGNFWFSREKKNAEGPRQDFDRLKSLKDVGSRPISWKFQRWLSIENKYILYVGKNSDNSFMTKKIHLKIWKLDNFTKILKICLKTRSHFILGCIFSFGYFLKICRDVLWKDLKRKEISEGFLQSN